MAFSRLARRVPIAAARCFVTAASLPISVPFSISAFIPVLPPTAFAQSAFDPPALHPVVVTGTREAQALNRSSADLVLIDSATVRNSTADSVEDLLRREAGLQINRNGGPGQSAGYFIRGVSANGVVVLIDGVRVGSASLGQVDFEALSLAQIDHVEVLRGPASGLYGADGVGGVVQIFTRRGDGPARLSGGAAFGGYRSKAADLGVSGSQAGFDYAAMLGRDSSRGVSAVRPGDQFGLFNPDDDGFGRNHGDLRVGYTPAPGHRIGVSVLASRLNARYDGAEYTPPSFAPDPSGDFRSRLSTQVGTVDYRGEISPLWTTTLQASRNTDDLTSGGTTFSHFRTGRQQGTWQNALHLGTGQQLVLAYEYLHEQVDASLFANRLSRSNNAAIAGYAGQFDLVGREAGLEASLRHDGNSVYGGNTTGNVGATVDLGSGFRLRALAGTSFRAPTFNDLFYPGFGIAALRPERGRSVEVGASWQAGTSSAAVTVYRNHLRDLIGYDPDSTGTRCPVGYFGCAANTSRARLQGMTLTAAQRWQGIDLRASVDLLDAKDADTGVRLPRRAAHQETFSADYDAGAWRVGGTVLDVGARPDGANLGGYATVDLRAAWRFQTAWRIEAKLLNALDHRIEPVRDYQGLGRQAWIGVRFDGIGL